MRILNRPMFRYGGPIKEGVMHGMRNGGSIAGGNQIGTPMGNRTGFANPKDKLIMGAATKILPKIGLKPGFMKPWWAKVKNIFGSTAQHTPVTKVTKPPVTKWSGPYKGTTPGGTTYQASGPVQNVWTPKGWVARDPLYRVGSAAWQGKGVLGKPIKWAGKQIATPTGGLGLIYVGTKWLWPDGTPANENEINQHLSKVPGLTSKSKKPGRGDEGMYWEDPARLAAEAKAARTAKLEKYLDTMGYDKAKKTAMGDALIDASAIVQDATTEAGSLKKADWGKMINKAIQTTSKRLDKPEQIREAVGLMMTKADIEKDMNADENQLNNDYKRMQIKLGEKSLAGTSFEEIISDRMIKSDMLKGNDLAALFRIKKGIDAKVISTEKMGADQDALIYVTNLMADKKKEGTPYPEGHYIISDRIVVVDGQGNPSKVL
jgi:hypothetical protein